MSGDHDHGQNHTNNTTSALVYGFPPTYVLYIAGVCVLSGIVRLLSRWTVVHHTVIMFVLGASFGYLSSHYSEVNLYVNLDFLTSARLLQVHTLLLPIIILEYLFGMDPRVFLSCSPIAVITVVFDYVLTMLVQGLFILFFLDFYEVPSNPTKSVLIYLLVGSLTSVTDTSYVVNTFYKMGSYWVLVKLLEIKRVISLVGACCVYIFVVYVNELNYEIGWYNIFIFFVFQFFASPALGWLIAQIMIFWIGRLYNDIGVEITVSIAVAYLLYYFGTVNITDKPMVSAVAVVVYALLLNNRRTCFSLGLDVFLYKIARVLSYVVKTVVFTIAGFLLTYEDTTTFGEGGRMLFPQLLVSFTCYSWCMLSRGMVCALAAPVLRRCGYKLSWQELSTMVFCNVTGTVCLITAVASCNKGLVRLFYNDRHIQYMLMFHLGVLALIRSLVAGTFFRHVLMVLGMRHVSLGRYVAMNNAISKVQEQVSNSSRTYKFDRFLADADWETVHQFTNFDDPYKDISRYSVIGRAMDLDTNLLGDLRLNMLHSKRMSFWRQYEQGLLSLRALRILLEECYLAEWNVTSSYDIGDQIRKHYQIKSKGMFGLLETVKEKFENMQEIRRGIIEDLWHGVKGKWKKMVFKIGLHVFMEIALIITAILMTAFSIVILIYESTCPASLDPVLMHLFYFEFNIAFMVFITIYIVFKLYIFRWRYLVLFGSFFNLSLVAVGWIDVCLHGVVLMEPQETCATLIRTQWAITFHIVLQKFFIFYRCLRILVLLQDKTYIFVHAMKRRMLLRLQLGYDVGKAYVYCKEDVFQTAGEFVTNQVTLGEIRKELQTSRVQLMRELATVQKKYPGIVVSVKSQEACRRLLHVAKETVNQLQSNGRIDAYEADMLDEMIKLRLKRLNQVPAQIEMPSVDVLISKLQWVLNDEQMMKYLQFNAKLFNMAEGESADFDSDPTAGLYILVSGLIRVNWSIGEPYGKLLQASHSNSEDTILSVGRMQLHDYMTTGSTFGELALLTETPIAIDAVCETTVLMYHIQYESIRTALDWVREPSLEKGLWQIAAVRLSLPLLKALPAYYNTSLEDLKVLIDHGSLTVQRLESQYQDGTNEEKLNLARYISHHVILIHGTGTKSGETFIGPVIIPPDNDDLVFSSVICDLFVLYIVPYRTVAASVAYATVTSASPSEISTVNVEQSKEGASVQLGVPSRAVVHKKRGRKSLTGTAPTAAAAAAKHADHMTSPFRRVSDRAMSELQPAPVPETGKKHYSPEEESPENLLSISSTMPFSQTSKQGLSPQIAKPLETAEPVKEVEEVPLATPRRISAVKQLDTIKPIDEKETEVPARKTEVPTPTGSPPKRVSISAQNVPEKIKEAEIEKVLVDEESAQEDVIPRTSISDVTDKKGPYTEAWKRVRPEIKLTLGKVPEKTPKLTTSKMPGRDERGAATKSDAVAADDTVRRQVTQPNVDEENENVNNSTNNNSNISCERRSQAEYIVSSDVASFKLLGMPYSPVSEDKTTAVEFLTAEETETRQSIVVSASNVPATGRSYKIHDDENKISSGLSPLEDIATSSIANVRDNLIVDLQSSSATPSSDSEAIDLTEGIPTVSKTDEYQTINVGVGHTPEILTEKVATDQKEDGVLVTTNEIRYEVLSRSARNSVAFGSQSKTEQSTSEKIADFKPAMSKLHDTVTTKAAGKITSKKPETERPKQPAKTDSTRYYVRAFNSSPRAPLAGHSTTSFTKPSPTVNRINVQPVTYVEPRHASSSTSESDDDSVSPSITQSRSQNMRGATSSSRPKPVRKSESREKKSSTFDNGISRASAN